MPKRILIEYRYGRRMKLPKNAVYVDKGSEWGNPFINKDNPQAAVNAYASHFLDSPSYEVIEEYSWEDEPHGWFNGDIDRGQLRLLRYLEENDGYRGKYFQDIRAVRGKDLACFCSLDKPSHADFLLEWANGGIIE